MMNCFWTKATIAWSYPDIVRFTDEDKSYNFWLTNFDDDPGYLASLTSGFRCALSNLVAFSSILGRAGPLEAFIVVVVGTIGYELNRQILYAFNIDSGGTNSIFIFGGFMSLMIGVMRWLR